MWVGENANYACNIVTMFEVSHHT